MGEIMGLDGFVQGCMVIANTSRRSLYTLIFIDLSLSSNY